MGVQRNNDRPKEHLLRERPSNEVPPTDPAAQRFVQFFPIDPAAPTGLYDGLLEEWAGEKEGCENDASPNSKGRDWEYA